MRPLDFFIIDDSEVNNYYTEDLLDEIDFVQSVVIFTNAADALKEITDRHDTKSKQPDVILLDIRMPEMDGFEFLEEIDQQIDDFQEHTKVFLLTSSKHRHDIEAYDKQQLASEFLNKPLEKKQLIVKVNNYFLEE